MQQLHSLLCLPGKRCNIVHLPQSMPHTLCPKSSATRVLICLVFIIFLKCLMLNLLELHTIARSRRLTYTDVDLFHAIIDLSEHSRCRADPTQMS